MRPGILLLAAAGLLAVPAAAQPPGGSRIDPAPGAVRPHSGEDRISAQRVMRTFAACLLRNNPRTANEILLAPFASPEQQAVINRRVAGIHNCMGAGMSMGFHAGGLAGALSEASLQSRFAAVNLERVSALTPDTITLLNLNPRNGYEELGLCVARRAPELVWAWAVSAPGSAAEAAAQRAVLPQVAPCVDQGQPLRADVFGLRAILSAGLYRALYKTRP